MRVVKCVQSFFAVLLVHFLPFLGVFVPDCLAVVQLLFLEGHLVALVVDEFVVVLGVVVAEGADVALHEEDEAEFDREGAHHHEVYVGEIVLQGVPLVIGLGLVND